MSHEYTMTFEGPFGSFRAPTIMDENQRLAELVRRHELLSQMGVERPKIRPTEGEALNALARYLTFRGLFPQQRQRVGFPDVAPPVSWRAMLREVYRPEETPVFGPEIWEREGPLVFGQ